MSKSKQYFDEIREMIMGLVMGFKIKHIEYECFCDEIEYELFKVLKNCYDCPSNLFIKMLSHALIQPFNDIDGLVSLTMRNILNDCLPKAFKHIESTTLKFFTESEWETIRDTYYRKIKYKGAK